MSNGSGTALTVGSVVAQSGIRVKVSYPVAWVRYDDGLEQEFPLDRLRLADFRHSVPWRQVRSRHGQAHYSGSYASATTGGFVVYESRLELARLLLADFDPQVERIYSQPFRVAAPRWRPGPASCAGFPAGDGGGNGAAGERQARGAAAGPAGDRLTDARWACPAGAGSNLYPVCGGGLGYEQAKAKLCCVESDEVAVAFGPPA